MSFLNIPHCSFPQVLSSPTGSRSRPSASTTSMGRSLRENPCEPARWSGMSGRMANPAPNTGYEPNPSNFFSCMDTAHADLPLRQPPRFPLPGRRHRDRSRWFAALRSIQQQQNSSKQSSLNVRTYKPLETDGRSCVGSTRPPGNWSNFGQRQF